MINNYHGVKGANDPIENKGEAPCLSSIRIVASSTQSALSQDLLSQVLSIPAEVVDLRLTTARKNRHSCHHSLRPILALCTSGALLRKPVCKMITHWG